MGRTKEQAETQVSRFHRRINPPMSSPEKRKWGKGKFRKLASLVGGEREWRVGPALVLSALLLVGAVRPVEGQLLTEVMRPVEGPVLTGEGLLRVCRGRVLGEPFTNLVDALFSGSCIGFVAGAAQALSDFKVICPPTSSTAMTWVREVYSFLQYNPQRLQENRYVLVKAALQLAYPCPPRP